MNPWKSCKEKFKNFFCKLWQYNYFTFFIIADLFQFIVLIIVTVVFFIEREEYVWFNSKILTVNNIMKDNYQKYIIYHSFHSRYDYYALKYSYYDLLKNATKGECGKDLKQCGILDTYGNKLCLYKDYPCPINEIIVDEKEKFEEYKNKGYNNVSYIFLYSDSPMTFYYTNTSINKPIISLLLYVDLRQIRLPKFIGNHTFIFDIEAFDRKYEFKFLNNTNTSNLVNNNVNENIDVEDLNFTTVVQSNEKSSVTLWNNVTETSIKLKQNPELEKYIDYKMNQNEKYGNNFTKIYERGYYRNFIGFENLEQYNNFKKMDFTVYKDMYPHNIRIYFIFFFEVVLFFFIIASFKKLCEDKEDEEDKEDKEEKENSESKEEEIKIENKEDEIKNEGKEENIENERKEEKEENESKEHKFFFIICGFCLCFFIFIFFLYTIKSSKTEVNGYSALKKKLKKIKADKYIEEFINEFLKKNYESVVIYATSIVFFSLSFIFFFLSFIFYVKKINRDIRDNNLRNERKKINKEIVEVKVQKKNNLSEINSIGELIDNSNNNITNEQKDSNKKNKNEKNKLTLISND